MAFLSKGTVFRKATALGANNYAWDGTFSNRTGLSLAAMCDINEWGYPESEASEVEITSNCDTARRYLTGYSTPQDFNMGFNYLGAHDTLQGSTIPGLLGWYNDAVQSANPMAFEIEFPQVGGTTPERHQVNLIMKKVTPTIGGVEDAAVLAVTFKASGSVKIIPRVP